MYKTLELSSKSEIIKKFIAILLSFIGTILIMSIIGFKLIENNIVENYGKIIFWSIFIIFWISTTYEIINEKPGKNK